LSCGDVFCAGAKSLGGARLADLHIKAVVEAREVRTYGDIYEIEGFEMGSLASLHKLAWSVGCVFAGLGFGAVFCDERNA
jgi:hypothetical protein